VARLAGCREVRSDVVRIGRAVVIRHVAQVARAAGQVVVVVDVALGALQVRMTSGQRKAHGIVIEARRLPRGCVVAELAGLRDVRRHVIGIGRLLIIRKMASAAGCRRALKVVPGVAGIAGQRSVHAGQREAGILQVIEVNAEPVVESMTLLAGGGKSGGNVIRSVGRLEIFGVT